MKKLIVILILLSFFSLNGEEKRLEIKDLGNYCFIEMENASYLIKPNYPILPYYAEVYTFPFNRRIKEVEIKARGIKSLHIDKKIIPAPPVIPLNDGIKFGNVYSRDKFYPAKWYDYEIGCGIEKGERKTFLSINFYPCRYNPARNEIMYAESFDVKIDYDLLPYNIQNEYDLLIITPEKWDGIYRLKEYKEKQGIKTIIFSLNEINGIYARDDAEKIKYFIKDAIEKYGIKYVLLVGDEIFPIRYVYSPVEDIEAVPCDLYYADIYDANKNFSSWDLDKDGVYGEIEDKPDLYPDVYISRLPVSNENELDILVDKIINYKLPPMKAIMVGTELFWDSRNREGEYLKEKISKELNIETIKLYETNEYEKDGDANSNTIAKYINEGAILLNFAAHGGPSGMGWKNGSFGIGDLNLLHNEYLPIIFAMSCSTNEFDTTDCLGEKFLLYENGGCIAYAGSSRVAYVYIGKAIASSLSGYLDKAFFKAYYDGCNAIGEMFARAKTDYLTKHVWKTSLDYLTLMEFNLLGDASLSIPPMPLTSKAYVSKEIANESIIVWVETDENATIDLYYRRKTAFGGSWKLYGSLDKKPYEWKFLPEKEGYYEFYSILRKGDYEEKKPNIADAFCIFDFMPSFKILKPEKGGVYLFNRKIFQTDMEYAIIVGRIEIEVEGNLSKVEFYIDNRLRYTDYEKPFSWLWDEKAFFKHEIKVIGYDEYGNKGEKKIEAIVAII